MDNPIIIKAKKRIFTETVEEFCATERLPLPKINFDGCPSEGKTGLELAHSHPDQYKICISERQLKLQDSDGLKETVYHEMTHLIGLIEHGRQFENTKNELIHRGWKPEKGSGVHFIGADQVSEEDKRIRENPQEKARINEDSNLIKFLEGRSLNNETAEKEKEAPKTTKQKPKKREKSRKSKSTNYNSMSKADIEVSRKKLGIAVDKEITQKSRKVEYKQVLPDEEQERLTNNVYKSMDTGFGDGHGDNRWNKKKKGLINQLKERLGII